MILFIEINHFYSLTLLQSRTITTLPNTVYTPKSLQLEASKHDDFKKPTAAHGAPDPKGSEQSTTDDGQLDPGAGEQHPRSYSRPNDAFL